MKECRKCVLSVQIANDDALVEENGAHYEGNGEENVENGQRQERTEQKSTDGNGGEEDEQSGQEQAQTFVQCCRACQNKKEETVRAMPQRKVSARRLNVWSEREIRKVTITITIISVHYYGRII